MGNWLCHHFRGDTSHNGGSIIIVRLSVIYSFRTDIVYCSIGAPFGCVAIYKNSYMFYYVQN